MIVREWMNRHPVTVRPDTAAVHVPRLLACHGCRYLPVVDGDHLVGVVGAEDVRGRDPLPTAGAAADDQRPVASVVPGPVVVARADESVSTAAYRMLDRHLEVLPVVDRGRFVGTVSLADCARAFLAADLAASAVTPRDVDDLKADLEVERTLEPA